MADSPYFVRLFLVFRAKKQVLEVEEALLGRFTALLGVGKALLAFSVILIRNVAES